MYGILGEIFFKKSGKKPIAKQEFRLKETFKEKTSFLMSLDRVKYG